MHVAKPCEFICVGAMYVTKPYKFIRFGAMDVTKPYEFIGFGAFSKRLRLNAALNGESTCSSSWWRRRCRTEATDTKRRAP